METNYANNLKGLEEEIWRASQVKSGNNFDMRIKNNNDYKERIVKQRKQQKKKILENQNMMEDGDSNTY